MLLGSNPFARKSIADNGRNPFSRGGEMNKSLHKSESFFKKAEDAETGKIKGAYFFAGFCRRKS